MKTLFIILLAFFPVALFATTAPITGPATVCTGAIISLSDATGGGTWSSSNITIATIGLSTGSVTGMAAGTAIISYTAVSGTVTAIVTVNPSPGPAFATANNFCTNMPHDSLYDNTAGGTWSCSPTTVDSISPTGVLYHRSTCIGCTETDMVTYTLPGGCSYTVLVSTNPVVYATVPSQVCLGGSATAVGVPAGGTWSSGSTGTETISSSGIITGVSLGPDSIKYMSVYGCLVSYPSSVVNVGLINDHHVSVSDTFCNGPDFYINGCGTSVKSYFGDGTSNVTILASGTPSANILHAYTFPGTYLVKQVLYNAATPIDSVSFSYEYLYCHTLPIKIYGDNNSDCMFDSGDYYNYLPVTIQVDSNGVTIDTITATGGNYYKEYGPTGTVYKFSLLTAPAGMMVTCPSSGVLYDTIQAYVNTFAPKYFGLGCITTTDFDVAVYVSGICGRHHSTHNILTDNSYCTATTPVLTMTFSPKYNFSSANPTPSSVVGNVITWDFTTVMSDSPSVLVRTSFEVPSSVWLAPGDTIMCHYHLSPIIGDVDTTNNNCTTIDTVKFSYDPNEMAVTPAGTIVAGTQLQYTINFENTGNDTAFNISVMDTLSPNVDIHSLRIVAASAVMNMAILKSGSYTIAKFDFPGINLLDSSHHNFCDGMVQFNINTRSGLPIGTTIFNHAGIFFDDNPVVMTDTVEDIIGMHATGIAATSNASKVAIYPNPANGELTISIDNGTYSSAVITNLLGQEVISQTLPLVATQTKVNVSRLPAGMYYIIFRGESGVKVLKFEKM